MYYYVYNSYSPSQEIKRNIALISSITLVVLTIHMNNNKDNKKQTGMMANNFQSNHQACISQDFPYQSLIPKKRVQFSTISSLYLSRLPRWPHRLQPLPLVLLRRLSKIKQEAKQDRISLGFCRQKVKWRWYWWWYCVPLWLGTATSIVRLHEEASNQESIGRACRTRRTRARSDQWKLHLQARENCCCIKAAFRVGSNSGTSSRCFPSH